MCGGGGADQRTVRSTVRETATIVLGARARVSSLLRPFPRRARRETANGDFISRGPKHVVLRSASAPYITFAFRLLSARPRVIATSGPVKKSYGGIFTSRLSRSLLRRDRQVIASDSPRYSRASSLRSASSVNQRIRMCRATVANAFFVSPADRRYQRHVSSRT